MIFSRKKKMGKGTDRLITLKKEFDVLNVTPIDYRYSTSYVEFLNKSKKILKDKILKISIDELCDDVLDYYIDSKVDEMKAVAKEQYVYHIHTINCQKGILDGELERAEGHCNNLKEDLAELEEEIREYKEIKKLKKIY